MKKQIAFFLYGLSLNGIADVSGIYIGGGLGYGSQQQDYAGASSTVGSPALRAQVGYQFANWIGAELGWNYISQGSDWNNLGKPSSTIYDFAFTPGFTIPATPVDIFVRLGVDAISTNLNSSWYNQLFSSSATNFEYGLGAKIDIPETRTFVRAEYINYGSSINNNNSNLSTAPMAILLDAGYVFP